VYISKITLDHVRCFSHEEIILGENHPSLLIAGNNGTGKSAILRSIAMGLCDEASAGGLLRELPGDFIRVGEKEATITVEFSENNGKKWFIQTLLSLYDKLNFERVHQKYFKDKVDKENEVKDWKLFPWEKIFVVGYGAGLRTDGTEDYEQYFSGDAVYTLFKYSQTLQNPELAWRRLESAAKNSEEKIEIRKSISTILHDVLDLDGDSNVILEPNGIFITKDVDKKAMVELGSVGDGYRAITTVILDILSWQFLMQNKSKKDKEASENWEKLSLVDIKGIVIIDEIEKHLHPVLQRQIIKHLHNKFSGIQFIISTHSPLCVSGTADIGSSDAPRYKVYSSYSKDKMLSGLEERDIPRGLRYDQVLVDYFKIPTTINIVLQKKIDRMRELILRKDELEGKDLLELESIDSELKESAPLLAEREEDRIAEKRTIEIAETLMKQLMKDGLLDDTDTK